MRICGGKRKTMSMLDFWVILKLSIAKPCKAFRVNKEWCTRVFTSTWHAATTFIFEISLVIESLNERTSIYPCDQLKKEFWLFYQAFSFSEPQLQHLLLPKNAILVCEIHRFHQSFKYTVQMWNRICVCDFITIIFETKAETSKFLSFNVYIFIYSL